MRMNGGSWSSIASLFPHFRPFPAAGRSQSCEMYQEEPRAANCPRHSARPALNGVSVDPLNPDELVRPYDGHGKVETSRHVGTGVVANYIVVRLLAVNFAEPHFSSAASSGEVDFHRTLLLKPLLK